MSSAEAEKTPTGKDEYAEQTDEDGPEASKIVEEETVHESDVTPSDTVDESEGKDENATDAEETLEEEQSEKPRKLTLDDIQTAPVDMRFPTTNQAKHCFTRFIEYHKCIRAKGEGHLDCEKYARYYRSLCPMEWIERWNEQLENGTFPGPL